MQRDNSKQWRSVWNMERMLKAHQTESKMRFKVESEIRNKIVASVIVTFVTGIGLVILVVAIITAIVKIFS